VRQAFVSESIGCRAIARQEVPESRSSFAGFPPVTMSNGFTYHLQELAFFSWFYGAPSVSQRLVLGQRNLHDRCRSTLPIDSNTTC
jgi:hypothetical protein